MEATLLALKTPKGHEEIRSRAHGLSQKLRTLLIMVDGKSTVGELLGRFPGVAEIQSNLRQLVELGFVQVAAGQGAAAPAAAGAEKAAPKAAPASGETRDQAMSALVRMLIEAMGPDADLVTGSIERARTRDEFEKAAKRCTAMLEGVAGAKRSLPFAAAAQAYAERWIAN
jgi:pyruvate/2-oxoglutarate dehydrogenase complex dihydrolipoamide acyltransferase (E2) component